MSTAERFKNDTLQLLSDLRQDLEQEWQSDEPGINFFLLLGVLVVCIVYIVFATFYFSRLMGSVLALLLSRFLQWRTGSSAVKVNIGSFSISLLAGKVMFRNLTFTNDDLSLHINDGWIIFSYWRRVPKKCPPPKAMNSSRLHVSLNGLKVHVYNRLSLYQKVLKTAGASAAAAKLEAEIGKDPTVAAAARRRALKHQPPADKLDEWWDNFWRLSGLIKLDISSGRLIAGNHLLPTAIALVFENLESRIFLTEASNSQDRYMLKAKTTMENVRVSLVKSANYVGPTREDPPRTMGDGFAILQSAAIQVYYHQDLLGLVQCEQQLTTEDVPVWESVWRLDSNTVISYGPWAEKQRCALYAYFYPTDYGTAPITEMPRRGQRRIQLQHDVRVSLVKDAAIDLWFMRADELNSVHTGVKQGSSFEFGVPWITTESGFTSNIKGSLLCIDASTSLALRNFINCETLRFQLSCHYPRSYNAHQNWNLSLELHKISVWVVWDHKRFFMDLINEWGSETTSDLCSFVPYTFSFALNVVDKFEIVLVLNEKNWIDTSSTPTAENLLAAIVGQKLALNFALPFTDFAPTTIPVDVDLKASDKLAVRIRVPTQFATEPVLVALQKSARYRAFMNKSAVAVGLSEDWLELWRTETLQLQCNYSYHPIPSVVVSDLPLRTLSIFLPKPMEHPAQLEPDQLKLHLDIGDSEVLFSGIIIKLVLEFKDNYFSLYDQISDVSNKPLHAARTKARELLSPAYYRPMNVSFRLQIHNIRAHCLIFSQQIITKEAELCPVVFTEQLAVEMRKVHTEAMVQVAIGPTAVYFSPSSAFPGVRDGWLALSAFQFRGHGLYSDIEVPWEVEIVEYAWLMELVLGNLTGKLHPGHVTTIVQFVHALLLLALNPDEKLEVPERLDVCQHYDNLRTCRKADLKVIDSKGRKQNCESSEILKYKLVRVAVDKCQLLLFEDRSAVKVDTERLRVGFCNSHGGSFCENLLLQVPFLECRQLLLLAERKIWLESAFAKVRDVSLDIRLPCPEALTYVLDERRLFLQKHDRPLQRLYFLWEQNPRRCGCFGATRFFAERDKTGPKFVTNAACDLAIPAIEPAVHEQPGFLQSIIFPSACAVQLSNLSATGSSETPKAPLMRRESNASFHSAQSVQSGNGSPALDYFAFLDNYELVVPSAQRPKLSDAEPLARWIQQNDFVMRRITEGITDIRLVKKTGPAPSTPGGGKFIAKTGETSKLPVEGAPSEADWGRDHSAIYIRGKIGDSLSIFISPLALEASESMLTAASNSILSTHPAFIVQSIYGACAFRHHAQPLTATLAKQHESVVRTISVHVKLILPDCHVAAFQCDGAPEDATQRATMSSVILFNLEQSTLSATTTSKPNDDRRISIQWRLRQAHLQMLHAVEKERYDSVYNKVPVDYCTNWADLVALNRGPMGAQLKAILDLHVPEIEVRLLICNLLKKNLAVTQMDKLEVDIASIQLASVLGKPINDDDRCKEASIYEVLAPSINAWVYNAFRLSEEVGRVTSQAEEWRDLTLIRLLAEALDWHDEQVPVPDKTSALADVKPHYRNFASCPSCKLMLILLKFISQTDNRSEQDYFTRTMACVPHFAGGKTRKLAIIALLSHWQTIICTQVQLADHAIAEKYKAVPDVIPVASDRGKTDPRSVNEAANGIQSPLLSPSRPTPTSGINSPAAMTTTPTANAAKQTFQPGHRRDASTATRASVGTGNENQPMDLYHWILKAHKEYKERKEPVTVTANETAVVKDVNAMELLLSVFFWTVYEERKLESSRLDAFPLRQFGIIYTLNLTEVKVDVIEKKLILSPRNEMLVALTCHHLMTMETFEISGRFFYEVRMDEHELKPVHAILDMCYESKINNIRIVVALPSIYFINDLALSIMAVQATVHEVSVALKRTPSLRLPTTTSTNTPASRPASEKSTNQVWTNGVLNKLYDYQRSRFHAASQRRDLIQMHLSGAWHIKNVMLESVLTDLIVSMNLMKIDANHEHSREDYSVLPAGTAAKSPVPTARKYSFMAAPGISSNKKQSHSLLDQLKVAMKRASLIVSEHVGSNRGAVETKRILNCSLRESHFRFDRTRLVSVMPEETDTVPVRNLCSLTLGEIEGDLPMHAQSIHEVVLRHGPQLNEQLHRIVSQPQPYHPGHPTEEPALLSVVPAVVPATAKPPPTAAAVTNRSRTSTLTPTKPPTSRLARQASSVPAPPHTFSSSTPALEVEFEVLLTGLELNAMLLPSLKAKYRLDKASARGTTGDAASFSAELYEHQLLFVVVKPAGTGAVVATAPVDTFTLPLPTIKAVGAYQSAAVAVSKSPELLSKFRNPMVTFREGGFYDIELIMGKMEYSFSTDLLNQILFAEQSFRSELTFLLDKLAVDRPSSINASSPFVASSPFLFNLRFRGEGEPWVQLTASTPSRTAIRFTIDGPTASLTNRVTQLVITDDEAVMKEDAATPPPPPDQLFFGRAGVQVNVKLGQLFKTAMYEEAPEELQEVATFMTNIGVQNEESSQFSPHNYMISLNRPILLLKSTALDKAILLWLNYRNVHNYWRDERQRLMALNRPKQHLKTPDPKATEETTSGASSKKPSAPLTSSHSTTTAPSDVNLNLSLSIQNGLYVCVPLYSSELSDNLAALVISLQKSDVTVCIKKELACDANFDGFRVTFIDNFDEHSLREPWMQDGAATEGTLSNFFYFPHGSYKLCSSAYSASNSTESAKWYLSVKSEMKGMIIDFDPRIGKLMSLLAHTLSSLGSDETADDYATSEISTAFVPTEHDSKPDEALDDETNKEFRQVVGHENKVRWLERKLHEQSMLVADLSSYGVSAPSVETERRKLRVLELMRFKEFRQTMLDKLKRKTTVTQKDKERPVVAHLSASDTTTAKLPSPGFLKTAGHRPSQESQTGSDVEGVESNTKTAVSSTAESVDINVDVQINIATGQCILRANPTVPPTAATSTAAQASLVKRPSARDLKNKVFTVGQCVTKLAIPSVDMKVFYTSNDTAASAPEPFKTLFREPMRNRRGKNNCFYLALELASMPAETVVTPVLADFLEQVIEPLPESLFETTKPESEVSSESPVVPIVAIDTSSLPLDVLFHMVVQSSTIRFEGQQQRSSAADCTLKLPRLALMASTRKYNEQATAVGGIYLSATLSAFSLNIYSPHQQATAHDALSLTLDKLAVTASRTKIPSDEEKNKVQLVIVSNVGAADFNYDMRRLSELLAFPKPWYRKVLVRRLFFGDQSVGVRPDSSTRSSQFNLAVTSSAPSKQVSTVKSSSGTRSKAAAPVEWAASCVFTMQWKELNVNAQMSNTMGNTSWIARQGLLRGHLQLSPHRRRDVALTFKLRSSQLTAQGGAISGEISIAKLLISGRHCRNNDKAPEHTAKLEFSSVESRVEWMSRPIFIGRVAEPRIVLTDEWRFHRDASGHVTESTCFVNVSGSWTDLQMIITKMTVDDFIKISRKLHAFFDEQLKNSRMVWVVELEQQRRDAVNRRLSLDLEPQSVKHVDSEVSLESTESDLTTMPHSKSTPSLDHYLNRHWHRVLDLITQIQLRKIFLPLPDTADGVTLTGGTIEFEARSISLACMNGEMTAPSWGLFHMRQASIDVRSAAKYTYLDVDHASVGINMEQKLMFKLGASNVTPAEANEWKAVVCRVQQGRNFMIRNNATIEMWLEAMIGDALRQLPLFQEAHRDPSKFAHNVLELFQFPALEAILTTVQNQAQGMNEPGAEVVQSSFVCEFHSAVCVQTDFNAQVGFLPDLLKSYTKSPSDGPLMAESKDRVHQEGLRDSKPATLDDAANEKRDPRRYECLRWVVDPKIRFIDRFKWNPPVIDEVLRKLQIFDHRTTIPKVMQRGLLDRCDALLAALLENVVVKFALKE